MVARFSTTPDAYRLLLDGSLALAEIERAGVRVDKEYLDAAFVKADAEIKALEAQIRDDPDFRLWQRRFGTGVKLSAPEQLSDVLYKDLGYKPKELTASGKRGKADEAALEGIDRPLVKLYFAAQKLRKGRDTYLTGIRREMVRDARGHWRVHPSYNLNTVTTYRSSCDSPNWQNIPKRQKAMADMIRRCYVPRPGHQLVEIDYGQAEVRVAACYNRDRNLIRYVSDPTTDMHRDVARKLFFLGRDEPVPKGARNLAKANFVFAEFYGDFYPRVAQKSWEIMGYQKLEAAPGESLYQRLAANGVSKLGACDPDQDPRPGTYEHHVQKIERWFWDVQFPEYKQWKRDWYDAYRRYGGFQMHTGFAVDVALSRNDVVNYPIQGAAFHCLLLALIKIVRWLKKHKMRTQVIGEIHDCVVLDVHPAELDDVIAYVRWAMVEHVPRAWDWIIVPLEASVEIAPVDAPWLDVKECELKNGSWVPKG